MVLILMISISSLALADEADDSSDDQGDETDSVLTEVTETEEDVEIMCDSLGSEIRLLQLEKAITKNILKGEAAVEILKEIGYNTTGLEAILGEMKLLLEEVQAADPNASDAVQVFVDLKSDAIRLTKEYRETAKVLLSDDKYLQIRDRIKEMTCEQDGNFSNLSKKIRIRIKQFNRNQIHRLYGIIGDKVNASRIAGQYQNGTCTLAQVKEKISLKVKSMIMEKKKEIFLEVKEEKTKKQKQAEIYVNAASINFSVREQTRLNSRLLKAEGDTYLKHHIQGRIAISGNSGNGQVVKVNQAVKVNNGPNLPGSANVNGQVNSNGQSNGGPQW